MAEEEQLLKWMPAVVEYRQRLASLQGAWDNLALLSHLGDDGTNLSSTREAFETLAAHLVTHLGPCLAGEHGFLVGFGAQVGHEVRSEGLERLTRAAQVGPVIAKVGEQGKVVPCPLQGSEPLPVLDHGRHPLQELLFLSHENPPRKGYDNLSE